VERDAGSEASADTPTMLSSPFPDAIVYGTVCLDRFVAVDAPGNPLPGAAGEVRAMPGGEAFNTATALAGWGLSVLLTGTAIGNDPESDRLRELLDTSPLGLPRTYIPDDPAAVTPVCTIRVFPDGERAMSGRGFREAVAPPPLPVSIFAHRPIYATCPNLGTAAVTECLRAAKAGCPVIAMDMDDLPEVVRVSRILVTSREMLNRHGVNDPPEVVVQRLVIEGAHTAIVTQGARGCVVADREQGVFTVEAFTVGGIVDTTGAGDAFRAGLCLGLHRRLSLVEMVRFASAAAALHCQVPGGASRIPLETIRALAKIPL
jgi:sugar/nucleoside kinase (ribokinase family)